MTGRAPRRSENRGEQEDEVDVDELHSRIKRHVTYLEHEKRGGVQSPSHLPTSDGHIRWPSPENGRTKKWERDARLRGIRTPLRTLPQPGLKPGVKHLK